MRLTLQTLSTAQWLAAVGAITFAGASAMAAPVDSNVYALPAQPLGAALRAVGLTAKRNIVVAYEQVEGKQAPALNGRFTSDRAIAILLTGSGLHVVTVGNSLVIASDSPSADSLIAESKPTDIVVTGTRIRGAAPAGSNVITIDREAIERSGYATTEEILQSLPQNFGGGPNEANLGAGVRNNAGANTSYGSGINLRGLGSSSTLVLFNGDRPALGGLSGVFADLSLVPSSAIEKIEVLADGASAIYGSDAVAGVVNVRFRDKFEGAETRLRVGTADGDLEEMQASQLIGAGWSGGHIVVAYQFDQRGRLPASDRNFASEDLRPFGGPDFRSVYANPGTIIAADGSLFGIPRGQNGMNLTAGDLLPGYTSRTDARLTTDTVPLQRTHSLYVAAHQEFGDSFDLYGQLLFAERRFNARFLPFSDSAVTVPVSNPFYVDPIGTDRPVRVEYSFVRDLGPSVNSGVVSGISSVLGLTRTLGSWSIDVHGTFGEQRERTRTDNIPNRARLAKALADTDPATAFDVFGDGSFTNPDTLAMIRGSYSTLSHDQVWSAVAKADGTVLRLPGGDAKLAFGAEYRTEIFTYRSLNDTNSLVPVPGSLTGLPGPRHITAGYAELLVPVFGPSNRTGGLERLDISLAGRVEHYSDVGSTTNPKVGVSWVPVTGLTVRGTYGRAFRAPAFTDLIGSAVALYEPLLVTDPASPTGKTAVLGLFGYAPGIRPEKATTWTTGVDLHPAALPGASLSLTYFDINYRDRIGTANQDIFNFLANRAVYGGLIVDNPAAAAVASYYASPSFANPSNIAAGQIAATIDGRIRNLSTVRQNGIDVDFGYKTGFAGGVGEVGVAGTYLFAIRQQLTASAPVVNVVGTLGNPVDLRLRARAIWSRGPFDLAAFANYTAGYRNQVLAVTERVASWTTIDANLGYTLPQSSGIHGLRFSLSVSNLFDRSPPYVENRTPTSALGYDPDEASAIGRVMAVQITKSW